MVVGVEIGSWNMLVWVCYWLFGGCFRVRAWGVAGSVDL